MLKELVIVSMLSGMLVAGGDVAPIETEVEVIEKNGYFGVAGSYIEYLDDAGVELKAGYDLHKYIGIEGRLLVGEDYSYGAFIKPQYEYEGVTAYGLAGYVHNEVITKGYDLSVDEAAYGGGIEYLGLYGDVVYGVDSESYVASVGYQVRF